MAERQFSGEPQTQWKTDAGADRTMALSEDFWFCDSAGKRWAAAKGRMVDGATIPRFLWTLIGSPYTGDYRRASIVHDIACVEASGDNVARRAADRMFFEACREGGCGRWEAMVLYVGVRFGAWTNNGLVEDDGRARLTESNNEQWLRREFRVTSEEVVKQGETDDPNEVETRTDVAMIRLEQRMVAFAPLTFVSAAAPAP